VQLSFVHMELNCKLCCVLLYSNTSRLLWKIQCRLYFQVRASVTGCKQRKCRICFTCLEENTHIS